MLLSASAALVLFSNAALPHRAFVLGAQKPTKVPEQEVASSRRQLLSALTTQAVLLPTSAAFAGDRDRATMVLNARGKYLKRIIEGRGELVAAGAVTDDFVEKKLESFISALNLYGSIQRMQEAPDKISKRLQADAKEVKKMAKEKDYTKLIAALETYRQDIPAGVGEFSWEGEGQY